MTSYWTAAPMTARAHEKENPLGELCGTVSRTQPATSVRGSSRRIMSMRFRPANISVINRRDSSQAVIGPAVQNQSPLRAHQQDHVPATPPVETASMPERCSPSMVRFAAPHYGAPLTAARRSSQMIMVTGGFHERAALCQPESHFFLLPPRIGVRRPNGRRRWASLSPPQRRAVCVHFAESVRNRRIALLPSALWLCRCRLGSSIYSGCCHLLARTRRLFVASSGSAAHVRSHPNSAILQSEISS